MKRLSAAQRHMFEEAIELAGLGLPFRLPDGYRHLEQGHVVASHLLDTKGARVTTLRALIHKGYLTVAARFADGDLLLAPKLQYDERSGRK